MFFFIIGIPIIAYLLLKDSKGKGKAAAIVISVFAGIAIFGMILSKTGAADSTPAWLSIVVPLIMLAVVVVFLIQGYTGKAQEKYDKKLHEEFVEIKELVAGSIAMTVGVEVPQVALDLAINPTTRSLYCAETGGRTGYILEPYNIDGEFCYTEIVRWWIYELSRTINTPQEFDNYGSVPYSTIPSYQTTEGFRSAQIQKNKAIIKYIALKEEFILEEYVDEILDVDSDYYSEVSAYLDSVNYKVNKIFHSWDEQLDDE